jgi:hypothetical protein
MVLQAYASKQVLTLEEGGKIINKDGRRTGINEMTGIGKSTKQGTDVMSHNIHFTTGNIR